MEKFKINANSTWCSQVVTHPSTNHAQRCLTAVIGREPVLATWYGRWQEGNPKIRNYVRLFQYGKIFNQSINLRSNHKSVSFYILVYYNPVYIKNWKHARCSALFVHRVRSYVDTHRLNVSWITFRVAKSRICCSWVSFLFSN